MSNSRIFLKFSAHRVRRNYAKPAASKHPCGLPTPTRGTRTPLWSAPQCAITPDGPRDLRYGSLFGDLSKFSFSGLQLDRFGADLQATQERSSVSLVCSISDWQLRAQT
jgi:hypothetical protein